MAEFGDVAASDEVATLGGAVMAALGASGTLYYWVRDTGRTHLLYPKDPADVLTMHGRPYVQNAAQWYGRKQIGKPYAGPVVGQPESTRWQHPGFDCSSFVAAMYGVATGGTLHDTAPHITGARVTLTAYTDTIFAQTDPLALADAVPGDIVLYEYVDSAQPGVRFPHVGLWLSPSQVLDCRYQVGVGVHAHLTTAARVLRKVRGE